MCGLMRAPLCVIFLGAAISKTVKAIIASQRYTRNDVGSINSSAKTPFDAETHSHANLNSCQSSRLNRSDTSSRQRRPAADQI